MVESELLRLSQEIPSSRASHGGLPGRAGNQVWLQGRWERTLQREERQDRKSRG